jgi:hypothetical protein
VAQHHPFPHDDLTDCRASVRHRFPRLFHHPRANRSGIEYDHGRTLRYLTEVEGGSDSLDVELAGAAGDQDQVGSLGGTQGRPVGVRRGIEHYQVIALLLRIQKDRIERGGAFGGHIRRQVSTTSRPARCIALRIEIDEKNLSAFARALGR